MPSNGYEWVRGSDLPIRELHSRAKHEVLRNYLERYVEVLTQNPRRERLKLTLVDGFAGGGLYKDAKTTQQCYGSPLLMLEAMQVSEIRVREQRRKPFDLDAQYIFIEERKETLEFLKQTISDSVFRDLLTSQIHLIQGTFESHLDGVLQHLGSGRSARRAIFVLDQYGYTDVPMSLLKKIFSRQKTAEVILTIATDSLINYLTDSDTSKKTLRKVGLKLPGKSIRELKADQNSDWKRAIQIALHRQIHEDSGAGFYTPFFIRSAQSHRDYWLVHLSNHHRARDVMTQMHWDQHNYFSHFGKPGLQMLGYDPEKDFESQGYSTLPFQFDSPARDRTVSALLDELPAHIGCEPDGVTVRELFSGITNETPATSQIVKSVIQQLSQDREIKVSNSEGKERGRGVSPMDTDVVQISKQLRISFDV